MKKLILLFAVLFMAFYMNAQNVSINNDGSTAASSAMLDVKSTTKGFMMPRVTTAQRTAIASPALGLLVFDTDTKTIWTYDGSSWKNLYTSGGGLILPFSQTVNTATSALQVTNQGTGAAVEGSSTAQFGIGMTAKTTGDGGWGLNAFSSGAGAQSIRSYADNGTAFHGENNNPANTNTLMNLLNKGMGKTGSFQLANNVSTSANVQIAGNHLGEQLKIYQTNAANTSAAVSIENSGTGAAINLISNNGTGVIGSSTSGIGISGISNSNYGVKGVVNNSTMGTMAGVYGANNGTAGTGVYGVANFSNGAGVYGTSANGTGVAGFGDTHRAVQGLSNSGTALYGSSTSGYGLEVNGKVKIAGGNTNPGNGKVLTSDANGNATWQTPVAAPKIAFKVSDVITVDGTTNIFLASEYKRVQYKNVEYDISNSFEIYAGSEDGSAGTFRAPLGGVYHFDAAVNFLFATTWDYREINMELRVYRNGATSTLARTGSYINSVDNTLVTLSTDVRLYANDIVWIVVNQWNTVSLPSPLVAGIENYFNGHLVFQY